MTPALKRIAIAAATVLIATFIADFFLHQHIKFGPEDFPGFYSLFAFVGGGIVVLAAIVLPWLLRARADD